MFRKKVEAGAQPDSQFEAWVIEAARSILAEIALEKPRLRTSRIAEIIQAARGGAQPEPDERSLKDYAIEHGGYLADAAQAYLDERNRFEAASEIGSEEVQDSDSLSDHFSALRDAIYEFRKRAARARASIVYTDLTVRCHTCGGTCIWRYSEEKDEIEVFHGCKAGVTGNEGKDGTLTSARQDSDGDKRSGVGNLGDNQPESAPLAAVPVATISHGADPMAGGAIWVKSHNVEVFNEASPVVTPEQYVKNLRESCHDTYNGGHHDRYVLDAFHHGMDTVCNVLAGGSLSRFAEAKVSELEAQLQQARQERNLMSKTADEYMEQAEKAEAELERMRAGGKS